MNRHLARLFVTPRGYFVSCSASDTYIGFELDQAIYERITEMREQERVVLARLAKEDPMLFQEVCLKHLSHQQLSICLRSEEELTMMRYYLECETVCASQTWPLARVEETSQYHLR